MVYQGRVYALGTCHATVSPYSTHLEPTRYGPLMDIALGIVGAVIGGWIMSALGFAPGGMAYTIIVAILGACLLVAIARAMSGRKPVA